MSQVRLFRLAYWQPMPTISSCYLEHVFKLFRSHSCGQLEGKLAALPGASLIVRTPSRFNVQFIRKMLVSELLYNNCADI